MNIWLNVKNAIALDLLLVARIITCYFLHALIFFLLISIVSYRSLAKAVRDCAI